MKPNWGWFKRHIMMLDDSDDSCMIWTGALRFDGRGRAFANGEKRAHRVAWALLNGREIPKGMQLIQECAHPQCVRHWRLDRPFKKLSDAEVHSIRASMMPAHALAVRYGVSTVYVRRIRCGMVRVSRDKRTCVTGDTTLGTVCA